MSDGLESISRPLKVNYPSPTDLIGLKILVIDDSKHIRSFVEALLKREKIEVTAVASGKEAVKLNETNDYDLIFIDINMPDLDGFETLSLIRSKDHSTPAIAFSAGDSDHIIDHSVNFSDFLPKPIEQEQLLDIVRKHARTSNIKSISKQ